MYFFLVWLTSLCDPMCDSFEIHPCCYMYQDLLLFMLLRTILLHKIHCICLAIHLLMDIWVVFSFWVVWIKLLGTTYLCKCLYEHMLLLILVKYIGEKWLGHMVGINLLFWETSRLFSKVVAWFTFQLAVHETSNCFTSSLMLGLICLILDIPTRYSGFN